MIAYFNGKILPIHKIKINPYDLGLLRAYAVFDVMRTYKGKPFLLGEHWTRLCNSAKLVELSIPINETEYKKIVEELLRKNKFAESNIRTVLTGGISVNGFSHIPGRETLLILIEKINSLPPEIFKNGVEVMTVEYARDVSGAKTTNYLTAIKNQREKEKKKAFEILYINGDKNILETSTSNFFIVKKGVVITSKDGILQGITRKIVIKLAKKAGLKVEEREIKEEELYHADEAFLTATNKDIVPIVRADKRKIGNGKAGSITKIIMDEFKKFVQ